MSVRFSTERLQVRDVRPEDANAVFAIWGDAEVLRYSGMDVIEDLERAREVVDRLAARYGEHGLGWWAVAERRGGPAIGMACLQHMPDGAEIEVGYYLRRDRWGAGLGTEIARGCIRYAGARLQDARIVAVVRAENTASRRVLEKAGLRHVGPTEYRGERPEKYVLDVREGPAPGQETEGP